MRRSRTIRLAAAAAAAGAIAVAAAGCTSALPSSVAGAPVLSVATGLWPLAQAATAIGGEKVVVVNVVPPGTDPLTYRPDAAATRILRSSGLVVEMGGGLQPAIEAAATGAPTVLRLPPAAGGDPYVWLSPAAMNAAVKRLTAAMAAANPPAAALYRRNAGGYEARVSSLDMDYSATISTCPGTVIVTPDSAFAVMAAEFGLKQHVVGPHPTGVSALKTELQAGSAVAALSQPWVDDSGVREVAAAAGIKVHAVDTLAGRPTSGSPGQNTYFARMEQVLGVVSGALGCNPSEQ